MKEARISANDAVALAQKLAATNLTGNEKEGEKSELIVVKNSKMLYIQPSPQDLVDLTRRIQADIDEGMGETLWTIGVEGMLLPIGAVLSITN